MSDSRDLENIGLVDLNFDRIFREEQDLIENKRRQRGESGGFFQGARPRFALAFSGGGTRAAAFQSGVLWRLAKSGRLKDVDYISAVSGGAYIASAFASEVHATEAPKNDSEADVFYLNVVARTIERMQRNAGNFVRDPSQAGKAAWFDCPAAVLMFLCTILLNPIQVLIVWLVPITECIQLFFGAALRAVVCDMAEGTGGWDTLTKWSSLNFVVVTLIWTLGATFIFWVMSLTPMAQPSKEDPTPQNPRPRELYLWVHGCMAFSSRFAIVLILLILLIACVPAVQVFSYGSTALWGSAMQSKMCMHYIAHMQKLEKAPTMLPGMGCANFHDGVAWYAGISPDVTPVVTINNVTMHLPYVGSVHHSSVTSFVVMILAIMLLIAGLLVPLVPELFLTILEFVGPAIAFVLIVLFVQFRIYGPITGQSLLWDWGDFDSTNWDTFVKICFISSLVIVPLYNDFRRIFHWYYVKSLRSSWFNGGKDISFPELTRHPYCPFLIYTGTVSDYIRPGRSESICEISFSPLHTGSDTTGYIRTPDYRTLAKCTALTAAGCLDAVALSMSSHLRFRFWMEVLNLSWGDYILFIQRKNRLLVRLSMWISEIWQREVLMFLHRVPGIVMWLAFMTLLYSGWWMAMHSGNEDCPTAKLLVHLAILLVVTTLALSFFCFNPSLDFLMFSPLIRQVHQATRYFFRGYKPPSLLYVSDGGVQDCTTIVQLMRRRCERILLVLAAADPNDELAVFRSAMNVATEERLGSFYDPDDPKRDIRILLDDFQKDAEKPFLHLGIRYGWNGTDEEATLGQLFIVKNRLPPSLEEMPVLPLLTEQEIAFGGVEHDGGNGLKVSELGGIGCSDCCHRNGCNCGTKFPHLTGANYLWLTPTLFSSLCRLGYDVSWQAIESVTK